MQINNTNTYNTNFTGIKLQTIKTPTKKIDLYRLNKDDSAFINRIFPILNGHKLPEDKLYIGEGSQKDVFKASLRSAINNPFSHVIMAIENNSKITGLIDIKNMADSFIQNMVCLDKSSLTREALIYGAMNSTERLKTFTLIAPKEIKDSTKSLFRKMGFKTSKDFKDLTLKPKGIKKAIENYKQNSPHKITANVTKKYKNMAEVLKLDE